MADEGKKSGAVNGQENEQQPNPDELTKFVSIIFVCMHIEQLDFHISLCVL